MHQTTAGARPRLEFKDVKAAASGRWPEILTDLGKLGEAVERAPRNVPCPVHGGKDGFRLFKDFRETGGGICNTCGPQADGFSVLTWVNHWTLGEALKEVAAWLGMDRDAYRPQPSRPAPPPKVSAPNENARKRLREAWSGSFPIEEERAAPLRAYLLNRGVKPKDLPMDLRFHPALPYFVERDGRWKIIGSPPAMLAVVRSPDGTAVTLHRTYITMSGKKSPVEKPKKMMASVIDGEISGGAIRLFPHEETLGLTEGIETALAVRCATGMPVWACVSDTMLAYVRLPDEVRRVVIWGDSDGNGAGANHAEILKNRLIEQGLDVRIFYPADVHPERKTDIDWADILTQYGATFFPTV